MTPTADAAADRFTRDRFLRWHGWRIHARPRNSPALWRRGNLIRGEQAVVALALAELKRAKEAEESEKDA